MSQAESARRFYDRISGVYGVRADSREQRAREVGTGLLALSGNEQVLEIGCGTGRGLVEIGKRLGPRHEQALCAGCRFSPPRPGAC